VLRIFLSGLVLTGYGAGFLAKAGDRDAKRAQWPETMLAARADILRRLGEHELELGPWYATGQLEARGFNDSLFPEERVELDATDAKGNRLWHCRPELVDGQVHMLPNTPSNFATYLFRTIRAPAAIELAAGLGSDDGLVVWLNGKEVLSRDVARGPAPNQDRTVLGLHQGENRLLLKIYNRGGGHGFYFSVDGVDPVAALWSRFEEDFPLQSNWLKEHLSRGTHLAWFAERDDAELERQMIENALKRCGAGGEGLHAEFEQLARADAPPGDPRWLALFERACRFRHRPEELRRVNLAGLRLAIEDLSGTFGGRYRGARDFLRRLAELESQLVDLEWALARGEGDADRRTHALVAAAESLRRDALPANPLLDFQKLLLVKRNADAPSLGLPQNWQGNCALPSRGYDNEIALLSLRNLNGELETLFRPENGKFVGDLDLHFDGRRMLFSMPDENGRWQIWEIGADGKRLRQITPGHYPDVNNYDACYLPDGRIIFASTRVFQGVPCVGGGNWVANLFLLTPDAEKPDAPAIRQLCFDQDHNWCPTVLNNGRVLFSRWEYSDSPHYFTRLLMHMNPDGTSQMEYYGSNSMWPNSIFYARPIPGHATKVAGIVSGHHGVPRMGELVLLDPARGRRQADGAVQRIPGHGRQVQPIIRDGLVEGSWPKFLHPYPLSEKHFIVAAKPTPDALWGIYLVDTFDNMVLLREEPGYALLQPVPLRSRPAPPVIPDRVDLAGDEALVYLADVYLGPGLDGVPRGSVKQLRVYEPHYAYPGMGGHINIGIDGPWDVRRIHGTVPVEPDGSASFRVPANTPLAVQPLDEQGRALQVMRSWFTAMPGEVLSCVGCHEDQNTTPPARAARAMQRPPSAIEPWYGPVRGFSFRREVQPVLDRHCVGCHTPGGPGYAPPDLRVDGTTEFRNFTRSYVALHPFVRRPGPESDYFLQKPLEFHASTSELVQMLEKGHHGVQLDAEAWDRLITWIDLNVPDHGTWSEQRGAIPGNRHERRLEMRTRYANRPENPEEIPEIQPPPIEFARPQPVPSRPLPQLQVAGWPFNAAEAKRRQAAAERLNVPVELQVELAEGVALNLVLIPAGEFIMGATRDVASIPADEFPPNRVRIERPFYLGTCEVSNAQYAQFDPHHDTAYISRTNKDHSDRGHPINRPDQPVARITWQQAMHFCAWLSQATGKQFTLPTEAQWEWACRAGTAGDFWYGGLDADFGRFANLADQALAPFAWRDSPPWHPRDDRFDDGALVTQSVGRYESNPWGLHDMHGNVAEWTRTEYRPYPYNLRDGRDEPGGTGPKVVRGGSWYDRPKHARSSVRMKYEPWQPVYNVGFRVMMELE
jgi:formylglycine-generating enzyme required for sulfatase activity